MQTCREAQRWPGREMDREGAGTGSKVERKAGRETGDGERREERRERNS